MFVIIMAIAICFAIVALNAPSPSQGVRVSGDMPASTLSAGLYNVFAVDTGGKLWGWGQNVRNALQTESSEVLYPIEVLDSVKSVSTFYDSVLAVRVDDTLWGWGGNGYGELGLGTNTEAETAPVKIMEGVAAASAGAAFSAVLKKDGSLWVSGYNEYGVMGNGTCEDSNVFVKAMDNIRFFDTSDSGVVAVDMDNCLWAWGENHIVAGDAFSDEADDYSLIDSNGKPASVNKPYKIMDGVRFACHAGDYLYITKLDGELIEWKTPKSRKTLMREVKYMDAGSLGAAVITYDDSLVCWELPVLGQNYEERSMIAENVAYTVVAGGFVGYVDKKNDLYCFGLNYNGLVGNGENASPDNSPMPDGGYPQSVGVMATTTHGI